MVKRKSVQLHIYPGKLDICIMDDIVDFNEYYDVKIKKNPFVSCMQNYCKNGFTRFVIILNFNHDCKITNGHIAHEALHATAFIMAYVGQKFKKYNHEEWAYLLTWITNQVYKFMKRNGITI